MNNHAGWGNDGRCVWCGAREPEGECDPRTAVDRAEYLAGVQDQKAHAFLESRDYWKERALKAEHTLLLANPSESWARRWKAAAHKAWQMARSAEEDDFKTMKERDELLKSEHWACERGNRLAREVSELRAALEAIEPYLPRLDEGPVRFSAHAQAAGLVRAALSAPEKEQRRKETWKKWGADEPLPSSALATSGCGRRFDDGAVCNGIDPICGSCADALSAPESGKETK